MTDFPKDNQKKDIEQIVQQFVDAQLRGENPDINYFVKQYPDLEDKIKQRIQNLREIDSLFASLMQADENDFQDTPTEYDLIGQKLGDFEVVKLIGRGGMGAVFLAHQISLDREVALKVVSDISRARGKSLERFKREAKVLAKISHPNIVPIYEVGEQGPYSYFAMGHIKGVSLDKILASIHNAKPGDKASDIMRKCLEAQAEVYDVKQQTDSGTVAEIDTEYIINISKIIISIASALDYAHKIGILHRDVKPSNILIDSNGTPKLVDFGLARVETQQTITISGEFFGTPNYVSPEQINKPENVDCRSDVYSLAATYYECLTLHPPFEGNTANETLTRVISRETVPPKKYCPRLSTDFNTILLHALEKSPEDRYQTATDFAMDIENVLEFKPITAKRPSVTQKAYKTLRRNPLKATSAFIMVIILGYFLLLSHRQAALTELYRQGRDILENEKYEEALIYFKKLAKAMPKDAEVLYYIGECYRETHQYEKAIESYNEAIKIKPRYDNAYWGLGYSYQNTKRYQEALNSFKRAIEIDPCDAYTYSDLGVLYAMLGNYQDAIESCTQACKLSEYKIHGYLANLASVYAKSGDFEKAIEYQKKAINLADDSAKEDYEKRLEAYKAKKP